MQTPANIQLIGDQLAILWSDNAESYFPLEFLRANSPSAETQGERDILGKLHGGSTQTSFPGIALISWNTVGNYALCFHFSDGHKSGLYTYPYLRELSQKPPAAFFKQ